MEKFKICASICFIFRQPVIASLLLTSKFPVLKRVIYYVPMVILSPKIGCRLRLQNVNLLFFSDLDHPHPWMKWWQNRRKSSRRRVFSRSRYKKRGATREHGNKTKQFCFVPKLLSFVQVSLCWMYVELLDCSSTSSISNPVLPVPIVLPRCKVGSISAALACLYFEGGARAPFPITEAGNQA